MTKGNNHKSVLESVAGVKAVEIFRSLTQQTL
jgi:hypothetical protein